VHVIRSACDLYGAEIHRCAQCYRPAQRFSLTHLRNPHVPRGLVEQWNAIQMSVASEYPLFSFSDTILRSLETGSSISSSFVGSRRRASFRSSDDTCSIKPDSSNPRCCCCLDDGITAGYRCLSAPMHFSKKHLLKTSCL